MYPKQQNIIHIDKDQGIFQDFEHGVCEPILGTKHDIPIGNRQTVGLLETMHKLFRVFSFSATRVSCCNLFSTNEQCVLVMF